MDLQLSPDIKRADQKVKSLINFFGSHNEFAKRLAVTGRHWLRVRRGQQVGSGPFWELIDTYHKILALYQSGKIDKDTTELLMAVADKKRKNSAVKKVS